MGLPRRDFIRIALGGAIGVGTVACGGIGAGVLYALTRDNEALSEAIRPQQAPTSAANRVDLIKTIDRPTIVPRLDWGGLAPNHDARFENGFYSEDNPEGWRVYDPDIRDIYTTLVVHHSVVDEGNDVDTLLAIQTLHREDREWADVAYHYFIGKTGTVYEGRTVKARGTHVAGYNTGSVGVCLLGNYMELSPNDEQITALTRMAKWLTVRLQLTHLAGHRDFNDITVCPGDNVVPLLEGIATQASLTFGTEGYIGPLPESDGTGGSIDPYSDWRAVHTILAVVATSKATC